MRRASLVLLAGVLAAGAATAAPPITRDRIHFGAALAPGDPAPTLGSIKDFENRPIALEYEDRALTVVNFWATWCAPCRQEMPALQALADKHKEALAVVGVLLYDPIETEQARAFLKDLGVTYPQGRGHVELSARWQGIGIFPTTFLIDGKGKVVRRYVGGAPETVQGMVRDVEDLLAGRPLQNMILPPPPTDDETPEP